MILTPNDRKNQLEKISYRGLIAIILCELLHGAQYEFWKIKPTR